MGIILQNSSKTLGAGALYFNALNANGSYDGERYLGDTPGFSQTSAVEKVEDYTSDGPLAELDVNVTTKITRTAKIQCKNVDDDNLAMFVMGSVAAIAQTATPVLDEVIAAVKLGRFYQLGKSTANPQGVRNVSAVVVTNSAGTTTYVENTDYQLDAALGRIYIMPGGTIVAASDLKADYTPAAGTRNRVTTDNLGARNGSLRFVANNTTGANRDFFAPRVQLAPSGDFNWKSRTDLQQMEFDVAILAPSDGSPALYIDGRPA